MSLGSLSCDIFTETNRMLLLFIIVRDQLKTLNVGLCARDFKDKARESLLWRCGAGGSGKRTEWQASFWLVFSVPDALCWESHVSTVWQLSYGQSLWPIKYLLWGSSEWCLSPQPVWPGFSPRPRLAWEQPCDPLRGARMWFLWPVPLGDYSSLGFSKGQGYWNLHFREWLFKRKSRPERVQEEPRWNQTLKSTVLPFLRLSQSSLTVSA